MGVEITSKPNGPSSDLPLAKLKDARQVFDDFTRGWHRAADAFRFAFEPRMTAFTSEIELVAHIERAPDTAGLALLLRHCVADVRSALDNAIYGMGVEAGLADSALRNLAFPIITSSASWAKKGKRDKLAGLPEDVVARVERVQPFSTLDPLPLTYLADLVNSDKHRAGFTLELVPLLPDRESKIWDLETEMHPADAEQAIAALNADEQVSIDLGPIWDRKVVARMRLPSGTGPQVRVKNVNFPVTLAVEAGRETRSLPVVPTMERVFDYVTSAVRYIVGDDAHPPGAYTFR